MTKEFLTSEEIINYIATSKKITPIKVYIKGNLKDISYPDTMRVFGGDHIATIFTDLAVFKSFLKDHEKNINDYVIENDRRNSAIPLIDMTNRSEEHTSELQSRQYLVCRLLLEKKKKHTIHR